MRTCRFNQAHYTPAGMTRSETQSTVVISGVYTVECCPFPEVDAEVTYICKMAKIKNWRNPFATASWFHTVLASCHPFDDGNGRIVRLLASIPLMKHGYPPISISFTQRADYYTALNKARDGDHNAIVQCILGGMREAMMSVRSL
ncbi:hypothetical protein GALMADRAFT_220032 [Galerina marginata CBS 339.88]|uniref:Fido domain-containing protein n=1 Tax=Galerina marginata (strain CBS 339.88) TaxID=685588 RepID=A0A067TM31_GALM3|nr:hypothetical protein GALMADRAFT_220032 [Galerina marginata CBS 339.88]